LNPTPVEPEPLTEANLARVVDVKGKGKKESEMWTDRYRPKKFTDLLGDDVRFSPALFLNVGVIMWVDRE